MNNSLVPFKWGDVSLKEACWIDSKPYFTRRAIGEWLGYVKPRPDVAITKIIERNPYIKQFARTIQIPIVQSTGKSTDTNLVSVQNEHTYIRMMDIEVYDPIGLQLIVMESRQPKAIAYKIAVAHLVVAYVKGELFPAYTCDKSLLLLAQMPKYSRCRGQAIRQLASEKQINCVTIYRYLKKIKNNQPLRKRASKGYVHKKYRDKISLVDFLYNRGFSMKEISKQTGVALKTLYRWFQRYKG